MNHYGKSAASGHYESLLFAPNGDSFRCNDSTITKVGTERLFKSPRFQKGTRLLLYMRNSKPSKTLPTSEPGPWRTLSCEEMGRIERVWFDLENDEGACFNVDYLKRLAQRQDLDGSIIYDFLQWLVEEELQKGRKCHAFSNYFMADQSVERQNSSFLTDALLNCNVYY